MKTLKSLNCLLSQGMRYLAACLLPRLPLWYIWPIWRLKLVLSLKRDKEGALLQQEKDMKMAKKRTQSKSKRKMRWSWSIISILQNSYVTASALVKTQRSPHSFFCLLQNHQKESYKWNSVQITRNALIYCFYYQHVLGIVGVTKTKKIVT